MTHQYPETTAEIHCPKCDHSQEQALNENGTKEFKKGLTYKCDECKSTINAFFTWKGNDCVDASFTISE